MTRLTKKEALRRLNLAGEFINQGYSLSMAVDSACLNPLRAKAFCFLNEFKIQQPTKSYLSYNAGNFSVKTTY